MALMGKNVRGLTQASAHEAGAQHTAEGAKDFHLIVSTY
jgi:hypothetical protein